VEDQAQMAAPDLALDLAKPQRRTLSKVQNTKPPMSLRLGGFFISGQTNI
jgi:hypothetical protein